MMKSYQALLLLAIIAFRPALAELTYSVTGTSHGKPIPPSDIVFERKDPSLHRPNRGATIEPKTGAATQAQSQTVRRQGSANTIYYSNNWCGISQKNLGTSVNKITSVHGYFQVPTVLGRQAGSVGLLPSDYLAAWVGIDGASNSVLLQAGVTSELRADGTQNHWTWLEWVPDAAYNIPSFPVNSGDWIEVNITATSATSGTVAIANLDQSYSLLIPLTGGTPLGRVDAEWIVEAPSTSVGRVPYTRFTDVWFEDCSVTIANGSTKGVDGATMYIWPSDRCKSLEYINSDFWVQSATS